MGSVISSRKDMLESNEYNETGNSPHPSGQCQLKAEFF